MSMHHGQDLQIKIGDHAFTGRVAKLEMTELDPAGTPDGFKPGTGEVTISVGLELDNTAYGAFWLMTTLHNPRTVADLDGSWLWA